MPICPTLSTLSMSTRQYVEQGVRLAVAHTPVTIGQFGGLLECISKATGKKFDNIVVVRSFSVPLNTYLVKQINNTC